MSTNDNLGLGADEIGQRLSQLEDKVSELSEQASTPKKKDSWDRLAALSPFISGVLIAGVGLYFTNAFQQRQIDINEADLAIKFFPHITSKDQEVKGQAFAVIQAVGGNLLIAKLAPLGGSAAEPVLTAAARTSNNATTSAAVNRALNELQGVQSAQRTLGLEADGVLGPRTRSEIAKFQKETGLPETGMVDNRTLEQLSKKR